jgi:heterodisulfide reductase subunit A-like polyferredoxin
VPLALDAEEKLRTDRASLREQCTWYFQDKGVSAREALPLMKIAIDEVGPID